MLVDYFRMDLTSAERSRVRDVFDYACRELGIGPSSLDVAKRERLAILVVELVRSGERNVFALRRRAVMLFRNLGAT